MLTELITCRYICKSINQFAKATITVLIQSYVL